MVGISSRRSPEDVEHEAAPAAGFGVLDPSGEEQAQAVLHALAESWSEVQPARELREKAERVLLLHPLSSVDSLQLAAALVWVRGHAPGKEFVCLDRRLGEAARREGFSLLP